MLCGPQPSCGATVERGAGVEPDGLLDEFAIQIGCLACPPNVLAVQRSGRRQAGSSILRRCPCGDQIRCNGSGQLNVDGTIQGHVVLVISQECHVLTRPSKNGRASSCACTRRRGGAILPGNNSAYIRSANSLARTSSSCASWMSFAISAGLACDGLTERPRKVEYTGMHE